MFFQRTDHNFFGGGWWNVGGGGHNACIILQTNNLWTGSLFGERGKKEGKGGEPQTTGRRTKDRTERNLSNNVRAFQFLRPTSLPFCATQQEEPAWLERQLHHVFYCFVCNLVPRAFPLALGTRLLCMEACFTLYHLHWYYWLIFLTWRHMCKLLWTTDLTPEEFEYICTGQVGWWTSDEVKLKITNTLFCWRRRGIYGFNGLTSLLLWV